MHPLLADYSCSSKNSNNRQHQMETVSCVNHNTTSKSGRKKGSTLLKFQNISPKIHGKQLQKREEM